MNLNQLTSNKVVNNNSSIIGALRRTDERVNDRKISIASGATIYLTDARINDDESIRFMGDNDTEDKVFSYPGLTCEGDATIVLEGENIVRGTGDNYAGIFVPKGKTLTIKGSGSLEAHSGKPTGSDQVQDYYGAGIGANVGASCGNIVIEGGKIYARSAGMYAAAIGRTGEHVSNDNPTTAGTENREEYSLSERGITSIEEDGEPTKRFFKVVIEKK